MSLGAALTLPGVDAGVWQVRNRFDPATWRRVTEQGERAMIELVWTMENVNWRASAERVESEIARLGVRDRTAVEWKEARDA